MRYFQSVVTKRFVMAIGLFRYASIPRFASARWSWSWPKVKKRQSPPATAISERFRLDMAAMTRLMA